MKPEKELILNNINEGMDNAKHNGIKNKSKEHPIIVKNVIKKTIRNNTAVASSKSNKSVVPLANNNKASLEKPSPNNFNHRQKKSCNYTSYGYRSTTDNSNKEHNIANSNKIKTLEELSNKSAQNISIKSTFKLNNKTLTENCSIQTATNSCNKIQINNIQIKNQKENEKIINLCDESSESEITNLKNLEITSNRKPEEAQNLSIISISSTSSSSSDTKKNPNLIPHSNFNYKSEINEYTPCNHAGRCSAENCACIRERGCCEKFCFCFPSCKNAHTGCDCVNECEKSCPCKSFARECDPDLCHKLHKASVSKFNFSNLNLNLNDAKIFEGFLSGNYSCCRNMNTVFLDKEKKTLLAKSILVDGFGLYAREDIKENDFICEYKGELISNYETDRRSVFNDHFSLNYFFRLNEKLDIDAYRFGNKMR